MQHLLIKNLQKSYGLLSVLKGIDLKAEQSDVIALIGPSGSGKSTLLRCINQLEQASAGTITIDDTVYDFNQPFGKLHRQQQQRLRQRIGMVFQHFNLWTHKTLLQNLIEAPLSVKKETKEAATVRAITLLERVGMADKQHCYPSQLSGGQQQRGAIARALMMQPEALLFDEPTSALDPEMVGEVLAVIQALAQEHGMILLIATHELGFARKIATHTVFLDQGKIEEANTTEALFNHPNSERLQQFLKSSDHHSLS